MTVHQQLLDYVRQQLARGVAKESITTALISQGWSEQDIRDSFSAIEKSLAAQPAPAKPPTTSSENTVAFTDTQNAIWTKGIPKINNIFMVISLAFVFGLDLLIIIGSPSLSPFWYMMLGVLAVFMVFFYLENVVFRKRFANSASNTDGWIAAIVIVRNIIFLLNFIPFIQLLGLMLLGGFLTFISSFLVGHGLNFSGYFGLGATAMIVPILAVTYAILIARRFSKTKNQ